MTNKMPELTLKIKEARTTYWQEHQQLIGCRELRQYLEESYSKRIE